MVVFFGKVFTATQAGGRLESVVCEQCGTQFHYELARVGVGQGSAVYLLGQKSAAKRAASGAQKNLMKRLDREAELVPCPKCHWVNQDLVERYRRRRYRRAPLLIGLLMFIGFLLWIFVTASLMGTNGQPGLPTRMVMLGLLLAWLLTPLWVLLGRRHMRRRIDPNATYPNRPVVPPGTPPALVEQRDPQTGEIGLAPVAAHEEEPTDHPEWVTFRPMQFQLPALCCVCLAPAVTTYRPPMQVDQASEIAVPLCKPCSRRLWWRWWLVALGVVAAVLGVCALAAMLFPFGDPVGRWGLFGILGFAVALFAGVMIPARLCRPYRTQVIDGDRSILKFAARNPAYTALLAKRARAYDGFSDQA